MIIKNIEAANAYLYSALPMFHRIGSAAYKKDIGNIVSLMNGVGNPHKNLRSIHIAGTNGKGSVAHYLSSYLTTTGLKCGLFISPHYIDIRERIKIDGQLIPEDDFVSLLNAFISNIESIQPSFFELITAMAFKYFSDQNCDFVVIETGMGGRLDSTNILNPVISVITNIGLDHQQFLGDSLEKIAAEKAGIIKPNTTVIVGEFHPKTFPIFTETAKSLNAPMFLSTEEFKVTIDQNSNYYSTIHIYDLINKENIEFSTSKIGQFQASNITTYLSTIFHLSRIESMKFNLSIAEMAIIDVKKNTNFMGRFELISTAPNVIADSAHNVEGINILLKQVTNMSFNDLHIIYGTVSDKDVLEIMNLLPKDAKYYWTRADIPRAMDIEQLGQISRNHNLCGDLFEYSIEAYQSAINSAKSDDLILICGSIFLVAEILALKREHINVNNI